MIESHSRPVEFSAGSVVAGLLVSLICFSVGCQEQPQIDSYSTPKEEEVYSRNHVEPQASDAPARDLPARPNLGATPAATPGQKVRMIGAIVPQGKQAWFYKMTGPVDVTEKLVPELAEFIAAVKYEGDKPVWTLPAGWEEKAGNQFRYATLVIPHESGPLEMSVSALPGSDDEVAQVVDNVNRWRGQVALGPITADTIKLASEDVTQAQSKQTREGQTIYFVNLVGEQQETGMRPPFAR